MSSLLSTLGLGAATLQSQQRSIATAGHNIANAGTRGYSRQRVEHETVAGSQYGNVRVGGGARIAEISRVRSRHLEAQLQRSDARHGMASARQEVMGRVGELLGELGEGSVSGRIDDLFGAFRALSRTRGGNAERLDVIESARRLIQGFNHSARELTEIRQQVDLQLEDEIEQVNQYASEIAELNRRITEAEASGAAANDLRDRRQLALRELSELADVHAVEDSKGQMLISLAEGLPLVRGGEASTLELRRGGANALGALRLRTPGGSDLDVTDALRGESGGRIGALLRTRDEEIPEFQAELDSLAFELATAMNEVHARGFDRDGNTGRALFELPATADGAAEAIRLTDAIEADPRALAVSATGDDPERHSNVDIALEMGELQDQALGATGLSAIDLAAQLMGRAGESQRSAMFEADLADAARQQAEALRDSLSGVSIDEEMVELTRLQKSFNASARVVTTVNGLVDTVLGLVG